VASDVDWVLVCGTLASLLCHLMTKVIPQQSTQKNWAGENRFELNTASAYTITAELLIEVVHTYQIKREQILEIEHSLRRL
jgi:hypothetical protein